MKYAGFVVAFFISSTSLALNIKQCEPVDASPLVWAWTWPFEPEIHPPSEVISGQLVLTGEIENTSYVHLFDLRKIFVPFPNKFESAIEFSREILLDELYKLTILKNTFCNSKGICGGCEGNVLYHIETPEMIFTSGRTKPEKVDVFYVHIYLMDHRERDSSGCPYILDSLHFIFIDKWINKHDFVPY